jgi:cell division protein FtsB
VKKSTSASVEALRGELEQSREELAELKKRNEELQKELVSQFTVLWPPE